MEAALTQSSQASYYSYLTTQLLTSHGHTHIYPCMQLVWFVSYIPVNNDVY